MSSAAAQHSANIIPKQWETFQDRIEAHHPDATYTNDQKDFLANFINADGQMKHAAKFALTMIRDELCALLTISSMAELAPFNSQSVEVRTAAIMALRAPLAVNLNARQEQMPDIEDLNEGQELFYYLEFYEGTLPLALILDIGWCLGFRQQPRSNSWMLAGKAFLLAELCRALFLDLHPGATAQLPHFADAPARDGDNYEDMMGREEGPEVEEDPAALVGDVITVYVANSALSNVLKLCVHQVWHAKYTNGRPWSSTLMLSDWLVEGKTLFTQKTNKIYSPEASVKIHYTAENTWIPGFNANCRIPTDRPAGAWSDAVAGPRAAQSQWIRYFCIAILATKVEPPRIAKRLSAGGGGSTSAQSRNVRRATAVAAAATPIAPAQPASASSSLRSAFDFQSIVSACP